MTVNEIVKKITEVGEGGSPKTIVSFAIDGYQETKEPTEREFVGVFKPIIKIKSLIDKILIDIVFANDFDVELKRLYGVLQTYGEQLNDASFDVVDEIPIFSCALLPEGEEGRIFAVANNPIVWALTAEDVGKPVSVIRMVFEAENVSFYSSDNMDMTDVKTEIAVEQDKREFANYMNSIKQEQRENQIKQMEEIRKLQM